MNNQSEIAQQVYTLLKTVPAGKVTTYGAIGRKLDINPRYVGKILHYNPEEGIIPCHRVVTAQGKIADSFAFGGADGQARLLAKEGVPVVNGKIDLSQYGFLTL